MRVLTHDRFCYFGLQCCRGLGFRASRVNSGLREFRLSDIQLRGRFYTGCIIKDSMRVQQDLKQQVRNEVFGCHT